MEKDKDGIPIARIVSADNVHVRVRCPHCSKIHKHGSMGGKPYDDGGYGHRSAHCEGPTLTSGGYVILP